MKEKKNIAKQEHNNKLSKVCYFIIKYIFVYLNYIQQLQQKNHSQISLFKS